MARPRKVSNKKPDTIDCSCKDWQEKIKQRKSLLPEGIRKYLSPDSDRALEIFKKLKIPDVAGTPEFDGNCGQWAQDIVRAIGGSVTDGVRWCREFFVLIPKKNSKALALDTLVPTTNGFKAIADIEIGDQVFGVDGQPINVVGKSEIFTGRKCYEVEFSTGEVIICDAEHLWVTDAHKDRDKNRTGKERFAKTWPTIKTTQEIADSLYVKSGKFIINNHRTYLPDAVEYPCKALPVHPYVLGTWLGDGHSSSPRLSLNGDDADEIVAHIKATGQPVYITAKVEGKKLVYASLSKNAREDDYCDIKKRLKGLDVIDNKHIPEIYLQGSFEQRLELLKGLLDTDGHITKHKWPKIAISSVFPRLAKNIKELVNSLGLKATYKIKPTYCKGKQCGDAHMISFYNSEFPVFNLSRKLSRQAFGKNQLAQRSKTRQIVDVREIESVSTQCISVDAADGQFLITRDYIPTHNTTIGAAIMLTMLMMNRRPNGEFLIISPSLEISQLSFNQLAGMIENDEELLIMFHIRHHIKTIVFRPTGAFLKVKSASPQVLTGSKPVAVLLDESHVIGELKNSGDRIMGQLRGGLVSQPEAFILTITTQSERPPTGIFANELKKARDVRDGKVELSICPILYEFPPDTDWRDVNNWDMVNPNNGFSVNVKRLHEDFVGAQNDGEAELRRWCSQHLNIEIGIGLSTDTWIAANFWDANGDNSISLDYIISVSDAIAVGIDGGGMADLLGFNVLGRHGETGEWITWSHAWVHPEALKKLAQDSQNRLRDFESDGDLTFAVNVGSDLEELADIVFMIYDTGLLTAIGVDRHGIGSILEALVEVGVPDELVQFVSQGYRLNGAIKTIERKLAEGALKHHDSRLMQWCVGNARTEVKGSATYITKEVSKGKIDPLAALINAASLLMMSPQRSVNVEDWVA